VVIRCTSAPGKSTANPQQPAAALRLAEAFKGRDESIKAFSTARAGLRNALL
jgi:hypothetical protein